MSVSANSCSSMAISLPCLNGSFKCCLYSEWLALIYMFSTIWHGLNNFFLARVGLNLLEASKNLGGMFGSADDGSGKRPLPLSPFWVLGRRQVSMKLLWIHLLASFENKCTSKMDILLPHCSRAILLWACQGYQTEGVYDLWVADPLFKVTTVSRELSPNCMIIPH